MTLLEYIAGVEAGSIDPKTFLKNTLEQAQADTTHSFVRLHPEYASTHVEAFSGLGLRGAPIGVKDIFLTKGLITSCASKMLEEYVCPYSSTTFERLEQAGGLMIGKTNMDEFAMGGSGENSAFGVTKNPYDPSRVAGGSSSGSAAAVAGGLCLASLGTDTGGSVRLPAALCGLVGVKPTYGRTSRYGVQAMCSSLDSMGVFAQTVDDAIVMQSVISGVDARDATTTDHDADIMQRNTLLSTDISVVGSVVGKRFALPKQFLAEGLHDGIRDRIMDIVSKLRDAGAEVTEIDLPVLEYGVPTYYVICPAEVSSNMARFDGLRFGLQEDLSQYENVHQYYEYIRSTGFGDEVKRRIMIGTYVLSEGYAGAYYAKAQHVRAKMKQEIDRVYETYDAIIGPTSPSPAWKIGEKIADPVQMYLVDIYTVIANLCGTPAISVPIGTVHEGEVDLPIGMQIMTKQWDEKGMFEVAKVVESFDV